MVDFVTIIFYHQINTCTNRYDIQIQCLVKYVTKKCIHKFTYSQKVCWLAIQTFSEQSFFMP